MVLVDTSVWVRHLREGDARLGALLEEGEVWCHPFVIGELACGHLKNRRATLSLLHRLHTAPMATQDEVLRLIEAKGLMGVGLGLIDVYLLASALLSECNLWTLDKSLARAAEASGVGYRLQSRPRSGEA